MAISPETVAQRRFTVEEYHRMAEAGILSPDERVELVRGVIRKMSPKNRAHVVAAGGGPGVLGREPRRASPRSLSRTGERELPEALVPGVGLSSHSGGMAGSRARCGVLPSDDRVTRPGR